MLFADNGNDDEEVKDVAEEGRRNNLHIELNWKRQRR